MLKTRILTAIVLLVILLPALFYLPPREWAWLVALFIGVAGWEWGGLLSWKNSARLLGGMSTAMLCLSLSFFLPDSFLSFSAPSSSFEGKICQGFYLVSALFWCLLIPFWLRFQWALRGLVGVLIGAVVLLPTWLAIVQWRSVSVMALLGVFVLVWVADIAAYFMGRAIGKHKLAPSISPGKTLEGAAGAVFGVLLYGAVLQYLFAFDFLPSWGWFLICFLLTLFSIAGDLFESLLKRKAGIKDSSQILPGHGGVLDRVDSLTAALPVAAFLYSFFI